jgi:hypothetical protein
MIIESRSFKFVSELIGEYNSFWMFYDLKHMLFVFNILPKNVLVCF